MLQYHRPKRRDWLSALILFAIMAAGIALAVYAYVQTWGIPEIEFKVSWPVSDNAGDDAG